ncbi:MAG: GNAT family N-acetyltransferase [Sphingobium sp.]
MFSRTERLLLRPGWAEDAPALADAIADPAIIGNLTRVPYPYGLDEAQAFLANGWNPRQPQLLIFSRTRGAPRLVGGCGIHAGTDERLELGYWIARPFWGLGFATEAADAVMRIARSTSLGTITSCHAADNHASSRVLRKLGFRPTGGHERHYSSVRGEDVDYIVYEDSGALPQRADPAQELYIDRTLVAA